MKKRFVCWSGAGLLICIAVGCWFWLPHPPILPDPGGCLRRDKGQLVFNGRQKPDILSAGSALLVVESANIRDNGEEWWPPHGPYSSLHVAIYQPAQPLGPPWHNEYRLYETMLYGPHLTLPNLYEWLDDEMLYYEHYGLYSWDWQPYDRIVLRIYESDPGPGREHDDLLAVVVGRAMTEAGTVTFRSVSMEIQVGTTGAEEQVLKPALQP